ncbi:MAG: transcriptional regulator, TetR family [Acidimicrobiales bacterium]|nr:transcriptional regulator, TetR family [Acidimicrobiales bacterium]
MSQRPLDDASSSILAAAREILAAEGQAALTVRRIAAGAGGSTMNVYSRFGGKDGVIDALLIEGFEHLTAAIRAVRTTKSPLADLLRCGVAYRTFALDHQAHYELMFDRVVPGYVMSERAHVTAAAALGTMADRVQVAMDAGLIRRGDTVATATVLWSACHGPVSLEMKGVGPPSTDWAEVNRQLMAAAVAGLSAGQRR